MRGGLLYTDCQDTTPLTNISERRGGGPVLVLCIAKKTLKPADNNLDIRTFLAEIVDFDPSFPCKNQYYKNPSRLKFWILVGRFLL